MYRATYSYEGHQEHTLDFIEGDQFTVMDTRDQYWWLVQNGFGEIGYVPANYLEADEVRHMIAVADPRGRPRRVPPYGPKFSQFHAVFWKIWQNHMLAPPPRRVGAPSYGESWIRPCTTMLTLLV